MVLEDLVGSDHRLRVTQDECVQYMHMMGIQRAEWGLEDCEGKFKICEFNPHKYVASSLVLNGDIEKLDIRSHVTISVDNNIHVSKLITNTDKKVFLNLICNRAIVDEWHIYDDIETGSRIECNDNIVIKECHWHVADMWHYIALQYREITKRVEKCYIHWDMHKFRVMIFNIKDAHIKSVLAQEIGFDVNTDVGITLDNGILHIDLDGNKFVELSVDSMSARLREELIDCFENLYINRSMIYFGSVAEIIREW